MLDVSARGATSFIEPFAIMALYASISDTVLTTAQISRPGLCTAPATAEITCAGLRTAPAATKIPCACLRAAALTGPILTTSVQTTIRA